MIRRTRASLVHQTITTVNGGPHVGTDHFSRTNRVCAPVTLDEERRARLTCELESCKCTYDLRVLAAKERGLIALRRFLVITAILAVDSFIAQSGQWVYNAGENSQVLRVLGDVMTGGGVVLNMLLVLWLLMSFWFWPPRYELEFVAASTDAQPDALAPRPDVRPAHKVKLLA
ncbi:MAG: hypothetical protein ACQR33_03530 [Candidatus Saccharibacteria bacterium]